MNTAIKLGDVVRDTITGLEGISARSRRGVLALPGKAWRSERGRS